MSNKSNNLLVNKKVAWFHTHILNWSGGTRFIYETLKRLNKEVDVTLFVEAADKKINRMFEDEGIKVVIFSKTKSSKSMLYWLFFPFYVHKETRWIKKNVSGFGVYISSMFPMNYLLYKARKRPHLCFCFEPFAFFHDKDMISGFGFFKRNLLRFLAFFHIKKDVVSTKSVEKILTVNSGVVKWIRKVYGRSAIPTYLGIDTDYFKHYSNNRLSKKYFGKKVIIHSTDYTPLKRTWFLLGSIKNIIKKVPNTLLIITCSQENTIEKKKMERFIKNNNLQKNVNIIGFVNHNELPLYYDLAEVCVYPGIGSGASACSYFVLECMASETPCVRTNNSDDETVDNYSGYLFEPNNRTRMETKITELLNNKRRSEEMGKNSRKTILKRYKWDSVVTIFLKTIGDVKNGKKDNL